MCKIGMLDLKYIMKIKLKDACEPLTEHGPPLWQAFLSLLSCVFIHWCWASARNAYIWP